MGVQLPLQFDFNRQQNFASFFPGNNQETHTHLQGFPVNSEHQQIQLWGAAGLGKTHLLQATCQLASEQQLSTFYLALGSTQCPPPSILDGLEDIQLVCLDDIDLIAGQDAWEHALFHFYNAHKNYGHKLLVSTSLAPVELHFSLPDLKTRLGWGLTLKLNALSDEQILGALCARAKQRGFDIPDNVGQFLIRHYDRKMAGLWDMLDKIDQTTLSRQRKLTIPLLKQIMAEPYAD